MDNEEYRITPKGIFFKSLLEADLIDNLCDRKANAAWTIFQLLMEKCGYVNNENENELERKLP